MPLHVQGEVIGSGETTFADLAAERFGARMFPIVTGQLVGTGETPLTLGPVAAVRFLTCQQQRIPLLLLPFVVVVKRREGFFQKDSRRARASSINEQTNMQTNKDLKNKTRNRFKQENRQREREREKRPRRRRKKK